jgi:hypothetical protein
VELGLSGEDTKVADEGALVVEAEEGKSDVWAADKNGGSPAGKAGI